MGQTRRQYPVMEVVLACEDCAPLPSGHERKLAGDIIGMRPITAPQAGKVGSGEQHRYLWLRLTGLEENDWPQLMESLDGFDKRRYCIPLSRLAQRVPGFDVAQAMNPAVAYQPFCLVDEDSPFPFLTTHRPLDVHGLVFDKAIGRYL